MSLYKTSGVERNVPQFTHCARCPKRLFSLHIRPPIALWRCVAPRFYPWRHCVRPIYTDSNPHVPKTGRERHQTVGRKRCTSATLSGFSSPRHILYQLDVCAVRAQYFATHLCFLPGGAISPQLPAPNDIRPDDVLDFRALKCVGLIPANLFFRYNAPAICSTLTILTFAEHPSFAPHSSFRV